MVLFFMAFRVISELGVLLFTVGDLQKDVVRPHTGWNIMAVAQFFIEEAYFPIIHAIVRKGTKIGFTSPGIK